MPDDTVKAIESGQPLTMDAIREAYRAIEDAMPWRKWLGSAELRATDFLPEDTPVLVVHPPQLDPLDQLIPPHLRKHVELKVIVLIRPLVLQALRKNLAEQLLGVACIPNQEVGDDEIAAMFAWLSGQKAGQPKPSVGCGVKLDQV